MVLVLTLGTCVVRQRASGHNRALWSDNGSVAWRDGGQCTGEATRIDSLVEEDVRFAERVRATYMLQNEVSF